jgi:O-antigen biosynthesis protein
LENEETRVKILDLLDRLQQAPVELYKLASLEDEKETYEFSDKIKKVLNMILISALKLEESDDRIKLSLGIESIEDSLLRSVAFLKIGSLKQFQHKIEFELIPLLRETFAQFYLWGYMVNRENGIQEYLQNDRAILYRNDYIDSAIESKQYKYEIAFVVVAYNKLEYTKLCVESLLRNIPSEYNYELILINHGSTDGTKQYFEKLNPTKLLDIKRNGGGIYAYARIIESEFVMQISNDVILTPGAIENMVACMKSDTKIGWVAPTTPNVSNLQTIEVKYSNLDELVEFGRKNNQTDHYRWEQRVRLCNPISLYRAKTFLAKNGAGLNGYRHTSIAHSFPDDRISTLLRRSGYKIMLAKDAFCHHFGSVTLKDEIQRKGEKEFYSKGRIEFAKAFDIDPWGTGFCYDPIFLTKQIGNHQGHVEILGINCGIGSNPLKIKEQFKEYCHNLDVTLWNITDQKRFLQDLKGISDFTCLIQTEKAFYEFLVDKKFDYIVFEETFLGDTPFLVVFQSLKQCLVRNGFLLIKKNNHNAGWLNQNKRQIKQLGNNWNLIIKL